MTLTRTLTTAFALALLLGVWGVASGAVEFTVPTISPDTYKNKNLITESVESATSSAYLNIAGADKAQFYFTRNAPSDSVGTSTFSVEVTQDGATWYDYNKLISNTTNTNSQDLTRVGSVEFVGATSTATYALDLEHDTFYAVRCIAVHTATSSTENNSCSASVEN